MCGLAPDRMVPLISDFEDRKHRELADLIVPHHLPRGPIGTYYAQCNALNSVDHHDRMSKTPASKTIPVCIRAIEGPVIRPALLLPE